MFLFVIIFVQFESGVVVVVKSIGSLWFRNVVVILSLMSLQLSGNKKTYLSTSVHSAVV